MTWSCDNQRVDLVGFPLDDCLSLVAKYNPKVVYYAVEAPYEADPDKAWEKSHKERMVLGWCNPLKDKPNRIIYQMPTPLATIDMAPIIKAWLKEVNYGPGMDHDGDNGKGFRFYTEDWGHVGSDYTTFIAIEPWWLLYGK